MKPPSAGRRPIRLQEFGFDASAYELVNRPWICGKIAEGELCREGPDARGRCRIGPECLPVREGDRYACARSQARGGPCAEGPAPDGGCSHAQTRCQPVRSIRAKRGIAVRMAVAITLALFAMLFGGSELREWSEAFMQPGALTAKHGAIADCGSCHTAAGEGSTPGQWLLAAFKPAPGMDSTRCLSCHGGLGEDALLAHGVASRELAEHTQDTSGHPRSGKRDPLLNMVLSPDVPQNAQGELACATCHREHRGMGAQLVSMSDLQCQTCHAAPFVNFAVGHPEFSRFPFARKTRWGYNHKDHQEEHFPKEKKEFRCAGCHSPDSGGERMEVGPFKDTCGTCHQHTDQIRGDAGIPVFALPGVDLESLAESRLSVGQWPSGANIDLEQELTPFMRLLMMGNPGLRKDLARLAGDGGGFGGSTLYDLSEADRAQRRAAARIVWAVKGLIHDLIKSGRPALESRLEQAFPIRLDPGDLAALVDQLPLDAPRPRRPGWLVQLEAAQKQWLPRLMKEVPRHRARKRIRMSEHEDYDEEEGEPPERGWYLDPSTFSVRYRPGGHGDGFVRRWLRLAGQAYGKSVVFADVYDSLREPEAAGQCLKCHETATGKGGARRIRWGDPRPDTRRDEFTQFTHAPHLVKDCTTCHVFSDNDEAAFVSIPKSTCAECHVQGRTSAGCLNCHAYHVQKTSRGMGRPAPARRK